MYIRNNIAFNPREDLRSEDNENVWIEVLLPKTKPIIVGTCYRPPKQCYHDFLNSLEQSLAKTEYDSEKIVLGDFNISFGHKSTAIFKNYSNVLSIFNMTQLIDSPTRVTDHSSTILDHILCNKNERICQSGTIDIGISDHSAIYCTRKVVRGMLKDNNSVKIRSMKNYNKDTYVKMLNDVNWSDICQTKDVNQAWLKFKGTLSDIIDSIAPVKEVKIRTNTEPWMSSEILEMIAVREDLHYKHRKNTTDQALYKHFCMQRNKVQRTIKHAKKDFLSLKIAENRNNTKKLWSQLKELGYSNKSKEKSNIVLNINDTLSYDALTVANHVNHFFTNIADVLVNNLPSIPTLFGVDSTNFQNYYKSKGVNPSNFKLRTVTDEYVMKELLSLNKGKSTGLDGISPLFLKDGSEILKTPVAHIVNLSITSGKVPDDLKVARVTPLHKKKSKLDVGNYRPVSVLSTVSKILEKVVYAQIDEHLTSSKLIYPYQSGFRRNYSTNTCLIYLTDYIKSEIGTGKYVGLVAIDVQKAFDCVNHSILCKKLDSMGIDSTWFNSYLSQRSQIVSINGTKSDVCSIKCGVPQGSLLGPLLYLIYCNDMEMSVKCRLILYADDSIIMVSDYDPKLIELKLAIELESINKWLIENKLSVHPGKCETILFASKRKCKKVKDFRVKFGEITIESKSNIKYLGSTINQTLSGIENINNIVKTSNGKLKFLYRHKAVLDRKTRKILSTALIQGHIDYAIVSWYYGLSNICKQKLQVVQNKMVRFILNKGPREHIGNSYLKSLGFLNAKDRVAQLSLNIVHSVYYDRSPDYLKCHFQKIRDCHSYNTRGSEYNFQIPMCNTITQTSFYYNAIKEWNGLPDDLRAIVGKDAFKRSLKNHLLHVAERREQETSVRY
jgi:hypothetical protein